MKVFDISSKSCLKVLKPPSSSSSHHSHHSHSSPVTSISFSPSSPSQLISGCGDGSIHQWDLTSPSSPILTFTSSSCASKDFQLFQKKLNIKEEEGDEKKREIQSRYQPSSPSLSSSSSLFSNAHSDSVKEIISLSPHVLMSCGYDGVIRWWDVRTGRRKDGFEITSSHL